MKWVLACIVLSIFGGLGGCSHYTAYAPAVPGKVYVVRHTPVGNEYLYYCEIHNNLPKCWIVEEIERD